MVSDPPTHTHTQTHPATNPHTHPLSHPPTLRQAMASELIMDCGVGEVRPEEPRVEGWGSGEGTASPSSPTRGLAGTL